VSGNITSPSLSCANISFPRIPVSSSIYSLVVYFYSNSHTPPTPAHLQPPHLLTSNQFVFVIAPDFIKAFNTVRHSTLLNKYSLMGILDHIYNWLVEYFNGHSHSTK